MQTTLNSIIRPIILIFACCTNRSATSDGNQQIVKTLTERWGIFIVLKNIGRQFSIKS